MPSKKNNDTPSSSDIDVKDLVNAGFIAVRYTYRRIQNFIELDPNGAFESISIGNQKKKALNVDKAAEDTFKIAIKLYAKRSAQLIEVFGEESLRDKTLDLTNRKGIFALADMIDGTDLLERRLSNWCSAVVFFNPQAPRGRKILASFVVLPDGKAYYASLDDETVKVRYVNRNVEIRDVFRPSNVSDLKNASVCFYGQKAKSFVELAKYPLFDHLANAKTLEDFRFYTLAGIPMVMNLIDHEVEMAKNIDAVFDVRGQKPHDVVPGAFLALKAGATVKNLISGKRMTYEDLENALMRPSSDESKLKYIIASTPQLSNKLSKLLTPPIKCDHLEKENCLFSKWFQITNGTPPLN